MRSTERLFILLLAFGVQAPVSAQTADGEMFEERLTIAEVQLSPPPGAGIRSLVSGPDGVLWFTGVWGRVGRITGDGVVTEFMVPSMPGINFLGDIVTGSDGNLWFTQSSDNQIGRMTTSGEITEFDIPWVRISCGLFCTKGAPDPRGIAAGADGNLWFTEDGKIGRITTSGVMTHFPVGTEGRPPDHIVTGTDGALWFDNFSSIGKITTAGRISQFPNPITDSYGSPYEVNGIACTPDGSVWYGSAYSIGRISPNGSFTEFRLPGTMMATALVAGPDANLWFGATAWPPTAAEHLGRITPDGAMTFFHTPLNDTSNGIVVMAGDPYGNVWFTEAGRLFRITMARAELVPPSDTELRKPRVVPFR